jgi:predicted amidophosphoribosyltransferase
MICPYCGHTLNFLTEVLALTQTGAQCPNCWNHLSHRAYAQNLSRWGNAEVLDHLGPLEILL